MGEKIYSILFYSIHLKTSMISLKPVKTIFLWYKSFSINFLVVKDLYYFSDPCHMSFFISSI